MNFIYSMRTLNTQGGTYWHRVCMYVWMCAREWVGVCVYVCVCYICMYVGMYRMYCMGMYVYVCMYVYEWWSELRNGTEREIRKLSSQCFLFIKHFPYIFNVLYLDNIIWRERILNQTIQNENNWRHTDIFHINSFAEAYWHLIDW